jgi:hypothetical protein
VAAIDKHIRNMAPVTNTSMHNNSRGTHNILLANKGKAKAWAGHDEGVRRNIWKSKQTTLFPGLVATPTKTRTKKKASVTPEALKKALAEAGLDNTLRQETLEITPLDEPTVTKIVAFVGLSVTQDLHSNPTAKPIEVLNTHYNRSKNH